MSAGCLIGMGAVGLAAYYGLTRLFMWMGFDAVQSGVLTLLTTVALTGLAYVAMNKAVEDA